MRKNVEGILIPSEEHKLKMYPMDFEEFLWAQGNTIEAPAIRDAFEGGASLGDAIHRTFMADYCAYLAVGGMPQVVAAYVGGATYQACEGIKQKIVSPTRMTWEGRACVGRDMRSRSTAPYPHSCRTDTDASVTPRL